MKSKENKKNNLASDIINWILIIALITTIGIAVHQRVFETQKCESWVEDRIFEVMDESTGVVYQCDLDCKSDQINLDEIK